MTPVELTRTRSAVVPISAAAAAAMRRAFSTPRSPVATLLHLLFAMMARSLPPRMVSRPSTTGAPGNWLRVNTAAAAASTSLTNSATSFADGLSPTLREAQRNPIGKTGGGDEDMGGQGGHGAKRRGDRSGGGEEYRLCRARRHRMTLKPCAPRRSFQSDQLPAPKRLARDSFSAAPLRRSPLRRIFARRSRPPPFSRARYRLRTGTRPARTAHAVSPAGLPIVGDTIALGGPVDQRGAKYAKSPTDTNVELADGSAAGADGIVISALPRRRARTKDHA